MKSLKICMLLYIILSISLFDFCFADTEEDFPKIGFVKNDGANVRAGDNINFESLCKLKRGDPIKIIGKRYRWFKIILPKNAHLYIKNDYVNMIKDMDKGVVNAIRVNLRAGPGTKYSILGQVSKPKKLNILSEKDGWFKIKPPEGTFGWMHTTQIEFGDMRKSLETEVTGTPLMQTSSEIKLTLEPPKPQGNLTFSAQNN